MATFRNETAYRLGRLLVVEADKVRGRVKPWEQEGWWQARQLRDKDEGCGASGRSSQGNAIGLGGFRKALQEILCLKGTKLMRDVDELFFYFDDSGSGLVPLHELISKLKLWRVDSKLATPGSKENVAAQKALILAEEERKRRLAEAEAELAALEAMAEMEARAKAFESMTPEAIRLRAQRQRMAGGLRANDPSRHGFSSVAEVKAFFRANGRLTDIDRLERAPSRQARANGSATGAGPTSQRGVGLRQAQPEMIASQGAPSRRELVRSKSKHASPTRRGILSEPTAGGEEAECYLTLASAPRQASSLHGTRRVLAPIGEYDA